jgi:hypothetical protein
VNLSSLPNLALLFKHDGGFQMAPDDPGTVLTGRPTPIRLAQRDMLVSEFPNLRQFNRVASAFAGRPIFGNAVVLPVQP